MNAYLHLLRYLAAWLRPVGWLMCLGAALSLGSLVTGVLQMNNAAFGLAIYGYVLLLALPYLCAWHPFRTMLGSRRLASLPRFRLRLGLSLLLFTLLLSLYLPLASWLLSPGAIDPRVALAIFIGASLYTFAMQWAVASPYAALAFGIGPFALIYTSAKLWPLLLMAFTRDAGVLGLALASALGWTLALRALVSRRDFHPPGKTPMHMRDYVWDGRSDWLGILFGNFRGPVKSAAGTVLLGYPDGLSGRFFMQLNMLVLSPAFGMAALLLIGFGPEAASTGTLAGMFLGFSLATSVFSAFGNGEMAARARLLWLRQGGSRADQWRRLERRIASDLLVLASIVLPVTGVALMFDSPTLDPLTYCLVALSGNVLGNYFSLAARLSRWSLVVQLLAAFVTGTGLAIGIGAALLPLPVILLFIVGLMLLCRQQAWLRFMDVDWHRLRPASPALRQQAS